MTRHVSAMAALGVVMMLLATPSPGGAQDLYSLEGLRLLTVEVLQAEFAAFSSELARNQGAAPYGQVRGPEPDASWLKYLDNLRQTVENLRQALGEKGIRPPGIVVPGSRGDAGRTGGSATGVGAPPRTMVLPLLVVLTAAEMVKCHTLGVELSTCAYNLAKGAATALVVGAVITVILPSGAVIMTGIAIAGSAVSLVVTSVEVGSEVIAGVGAVADSARAGLDARAQQHANAERVTAARMDAIVDALAARLRTARVDPASGLAPGAARDALGRIVDTARRDLETFREHNGVTKLALTACTNSAMNPARYAADAERGILEMERLSMAMDRAIISALSDVNSCVGVNELRAARDAFAKAENDLTELARVGGRARADIEDAMRFFIKVKAARAAAVASGRAVAGLAGLIDDAREARARLRENIERYTLDAGRARAEYGGVYVTLNNVRGAFPDPPPAHIAAGLRRIDQAYVDAAAGLVSADALREMNSRAGDEVARVEGFHRVALEEFADNLDACRGIADELPPPLRAHLTRLANSMAIAYKRGEHAVSAGRNIAARADACGLRSAPAVPPSVATSRPAAKPLPICDRLLDEIRQQFAPPGSVGAVIGDNTCQGRYLLGGANQSLEFYVSKQQSADAAQAQVRGAREAPLSGIGDVASKGTDKIIFSRGRYFAYVEARGYRIASWSERQAIETRITRLAEQLDAAIRRW